MKRKMLGAKKDLNAELNLTSFIDLLSTCVCFLLLSAVWVEVGSIEIKQSHGSAAPAEEKESFDLELFFTSSNKANLYLKKGGKLVKSYQVAGGTDFSEFTANIDKTLVNEILIDKNRPRTIGTATVATVANLNYGNLISTLDVLRKNKIVNIGVMSEKNQ